MSPQVQRFAFQRLNLLIVAIVSCGLLLAACGDQQESPTTIPTPNEAVEMTASETGTEAGAPGDTEQAWQVLTENEELNLILATPDLAPGTRRFAVVLTDGSGIVKLPIVRVSTFKYPEGSANLENRDGPIEETTARYFPFPYGTRGIHVTELTFDAPGTWGVQARVPRPDGEVATIEVVLPVDEATMSVDVGEVPPKSESRTLEDVTDVAELTTGSNRDESLYQISVADALENGRPTVVVFASPAFCTNAVCGPQVEVLSNLSATYAGDADFIHVDLYINPQEIQGDLSRAMHTPLLDEWGLVSQEWTFVMDHHGIVVGRFENFVPEPELEASLASVIAVRG